MKQPHSKLRAVADWLMRPVVATQQAKQRFLGYALRSRFFLFVAVLSALPFLVGALAATYKAAQPPTEGGSIWLLWTLAAATWVLFILTAAYHYWRIVREHGNSDSEAS
jgi:hypothetical protein